MVAKPKPTKKDRPKKAKPTKGICPQCAFIFRGTPEHYSHCQREAKPIVFRKNKTDKQMYEAALDYYCREITTWRDGCMCVIHEGRECGRVSQWGHVFPQGSSAFLVYELSNSFRQSDTCNLLHRSVQAPYYDWYKETFGGLAYKMLVNSWQSNVGHGLNAEELRDKLIEYGDLYELRHSFTNATLEDKVEAGFYGSIIREAWIKEGRI